MKNLKIGTNISNNLTNGWVNTYTNTYTNTTISTNTKVVNILGEEVEIVNDTFNLCYITLINFLGIEYYIQNKEIIGERFCNNLKEVLLKKERILKTKLLD